MTNEQLAAYLEMLAERLQGIKERLSMNLQYLELERHPETHLVDIPFHSEKVKPHPRANQPICLDELVDFIFELRTRTHLLVGKPKSEFLDQYRKQSGIFG